MRRKIGFSNQRKPEAKAEDEDTNRATFCCVYEMHLCFSNRAKLAEGLKGYYAKVQLENVSL